MAVDGSTHPLLRSNTVEYNLHPPTPAPPNKAGRRRNNAASLGRWASLGVDLVAGPTTAPACSILHSSTVQPMMRSLWMLLVAALAALLVCAEAQAYGGDLDIRGDQEMSADLEVYDQVSAPSVLLFLGRIQMQVMGSLVPVLPPV